MSNRENKVNEQENLKRVSKIFKKIDFKCLSNAVIGLYSSSSQHHGFDCLSISAVAIEFLKRKGIKAELVAGECAWRVDGESDGGVISHITKGMSTVVVPNGSKSYQYHAWIKLNDYWYLDLTTYQFKMKMNALNMDGQNTPVSWAPDFLLFSKSDLSPFKIVQSSFSSKVMFYKEDESLTKKIKNDENFLSIDLEDVDTLGSIYQKLKSGEIDQIIGPNGKFSYF